MNRLYYGDNLPILRNHVATDSIDLAYLDPPFNSNQDYNVLFKEHVGLSPKVLAGIFRFQRFYRHWATGQSFDLLKNDLYDYYYDQAHFTKEFKKMTGYSPRRFSREVSNEFGRRLLRQ